MLAAILLIVSIGGQWAILQSGAWVGMFISFSRSDTVTEALMKTFDGNHPCSVCKFVAEGKDAEEKQDRQLPKTKIDFFLVTDRTYFWAPPSYAIPLPGSTTGDVQSYPPPTPPPRHS